MFTKIIISSTTLKIAADTMTVIQLYNYTDSFPEANKQTMKHIQFHRNHRLHSNTRV